VSADFTLVKVWKHFKTPEMIVVDRLVFLVFKILTLYVAYHADFNQTPVLGQNIACSIWIQNK